jgi:hypothetical protein
LNGTLDVVPENTSNSSNFTVCDYYLNEEGYQFS